MPIAKFYHITINPKKGKTTQDIETQMNKALDWYRYNNTCYVVYSTSDVKTLMGRLKDLVDPDGLLFITELNISNRNGWMPKAFWEWIKKDKTK
jgi:hypothetical protein